MPTVQGNELNMRCSGLTAGIFPLIESTQPPGLTPTNNGQPCSVGIAFIATRWFSFAFLVASISN